jgi:hypothetical protein
MLFLMRSLRKPLPLKLIIVVVASSLLVFQSQFLTVSANSSPSQCLPHPKQYTAYELAQHEQILVDGDLSDEGKYVIIDAQQICENICLWWCEQEFVIAGEIYVQ